MDRIVQRFIQMGLTLCICSSMFAGAQTARIKDLVQIKGNRTNLLMGFGLVVGLNATGDSPASFSTGQAMGSLLSRLGMQPENSEIITQSAAAVIVTAELPAFAKIGESINVKASIIGDATSLAGGTLLATPLKAGDGRIYAVAQGPIVVGQATGVGAQSLTVAHIPGGGQIERNFDPSFVRNGLIELNLNNPDFTTSTRVSRAINDHFRAFVAQSVSPGQVDVKIPTRFSHRPVEFISELESLAVVADQKAVVILNERTGTVVMGGDIRISKFVLSHNGLSISVGTEAEAGARDESVVQVEGTTVDDLVQSLNAMGVKPRDLISILQSIHASGALRAEIKHL